METCKGPHVDFVDHLIDLGKNSLVIANHDHFVAREFISACIGVVEGYAYFSGSRYADGADFFGQKRRYQGFQLSGGDVIRLINASADFIQTLIHIVEIIGRADKNVIPLAFGHETGGL